MNWGLSVLALGKHFLLQGASLFWTMVFALFTLSEKPAITEAVCCLGFTILSCFKLTDDFFFQTGIIAGDTLVAWEVGKDKGGDAIVPLIVNLLPPLLEGIILVVLR